eukprot:sb/3462601/
MNGVDDDDDSSTQLQRFLTSRSVPPDKLAPQAESPPSSPVVGQPPPTTTTAVVHQPTDQDVQEPEVGTMSAGASSSNISYDSISPSPTIAEEASPDDSPPAIIIDPAIMSLGSEMVLVKFCSPGCSSQDTPEEKGSHLDIPTRGAIQAESGSEQSLSEDGVRNLMESMDNLHRQVLEIPFLCPPSPRPPAIQDGESSSPSEGLPVNQSDRQSLIATLLPQLFELTNSPSICGNLMVSIFIKSPELSSSPSPSVAEEASPDDSPPAIIIDPAIMSLGSEMVLVKFCSPGCSSQDTPEEKGSHLDIPTRGAIQAESGSEQSLSEDGVRNLMESMDNLHRQVLEIPFLCPPSPRPPPAIQDGESSSPSEGLPVNQSDRQSLIATLLPQLFELTNSPSICEPPPAIPNTSRGYEDNDLVSIAVAPPSIYPKRSSLPAVTTATGRGGTGPDMTVFFPRVLSLENESNKELEVVREVRRTPPQPQFSAEWTEEGQWGHPPFPLYRPGKHPGSYNPPEVDRRIACWLRKAYCPKYYSYLTSVDCFQGGTGTWRDRARSLIKQHTRDRKIHGELSIGLFYNEQVNTLDVHINEARHLSGVDGQPPSWLSVIKQHTRDRKIHGELSIGLFYNEQVNTLDVHINEARHLSGVDGQPPSCFIKAYLLPDRSKTAKRKTKIKKRATNPNFMLSHIRPSSSHRAEGPVRLREAA